jgi:DNA-binding NtrC family response regulator
MKKLLLVDDDPLFSAITIKGAKDYDLIIESVSSIKSFKKKELNDFEGFLIDYDLGDGTGDQILEYLSEKGIVRPVVLMSATNHVEDSFPNRSHHPYAFVSKWQNVGNFFSEVTKIVSPA